MSQNYLTSTEEIWKPVVGFEDFYEVSNLGRIKRIKAVPGATPGRILKPSSCGRYSIAHLSAYGKLTYKTVHSIVAAAFHGPCPIGHEIDHVDTNKKNNRASNLEYVTHPENQKRAREAGLCTWPKGENHHLAKLTDSQIEEVRTLLSKKIKQHIIAAQFGVTQSVISNIHRKKKRYAN
jgi:HNH endonuclease/NUMOD4 motif